MSGFFAAMLITPASYIVQYRFKRPAGDGDLHAGDVDPGAGLAGPDRPGRAGGQRPLAGVENFVTTLFSVVAIGLGTVVGTAVYNMLFEPVFERAGSMADIMLRYFKLRR